jgi:hypothetical protein
VVAYSATLAKNDNRLVQLGLPYANHLARYLHRAVTKDSVGRIFVGPKLSQEVICRDADDACRWYQDGGRMSDSAALALV